MDRNAFSTIEMTRDDVRQPSDVYNVVVSELNDLNQSNNMI